jgi:hypothetical protein
MPDPAPAQGLSTAALVFMVLSVSFVTVLLAWCYRKILTSGREEVAEPTKDFHSA